VPDVGGREDLALLMASSSIYCAGKRHYRNVYSGLFRIHPYCIVVLGYVPRLAKLSVVLINRERHL